ncbi:hypothetical protein [Paenibacillus polymyxa]|uniref:hypothetical protein n=1 Tax=Paenibacillus polymyxa TaxID=1406 RepID=UPI0003D3671F|nr:hypothetical protein [Paenibacillus polymyxa]
MGKRIYTPEDWDKRLEQLGKQTRKIYVACEEMNFIWSADDLANFRDMWRQGYSVEEIRIFFGRESWQEVILIALDQMRWGYIKIRPDVLIVE